MENYVDDEWEYTPPQRDDEWEYTPPLQAQVEKTQPVNGFMDTLRGFGSGLTTLPRAAAELPMRFSNEYLRPMIGKEKLDKQGMEQARTYLGKYEPETGTGKVANFVGSTIPYLAVPMGATLKGASAIGAGIGAAESLSRGDDFSGIAANAAFGGIVGAGGYGIGKGIEAAAPYVSEAFSGIPSDVYKRITDRFKSGENPFDYGKKNPFTGWDDYRVREEGDIINKIENAYSEQYKPNEYFGEQRNKINNFFNDSNKEVVATGRQRNEQLNLENARQFNEYANKIKSNIDEADTAYGTMAGAEKRLLNEDAPVSLSTINDIIDNRIKEAGRGSEINPAGKIAQPVASEIKEMMFKGALKNAGYTDDQIVDILTMEKDGIPLEVFGINKDELEISRNALDVAKQYLQNHKINYDADWTPASGISKNWASDINSILRENENYAGANDRLSSLRNFLDNKKNPQNSWLKNPSTIANKLSSIGENSGERAGVLNTLRELQDLLPEGSKIADDIESIISVQSKNKSNISTEIEDILSQQNLTKEEKINAIKEAQRLQSKETELYSKGYTNDPLNIINENTNIPTKDFYNSLNEGASPQNEFMQQLKQLGDVSKFEKGRPYNPEKRLPLYGSVGLATALHNPLYLGLASLTSPRIQKALLQFVNTGVYKAVTQKIPQVGITATEKLIPKRTDEYGK
jgi:hypothetical protein